MSDFAFCAVCHVRADVALQRAIGRWEACVGCGAQTTWRRENEDPLRLVDMTAAVEQLIARLSWWQHRAHGWRRLATLLKDACEKLLDEMSWANSRVGELEHVFDIADRERAAARAAAEQLRYRVLALENERGLLNATILKQDAEIERLKEEGKHDYEQMREERDEWKGNCITAEGTRDVLRAEAERLKEERDAAERQRNEALQAMKDAQKERDGFRAEVERLRAALGEAKDGRRCLACGFTGGACTCD